MALSDLVNVQIDAQSKTVTQAGFGIPLLLGYHAYTADLVKDYSDASEMVADGFVTTHPLYLMFQIVKGQNPSVTKVKIGRMPVAHTHTLELTPINTTQGTIYKFKVILRPGGAETQITYTVPGAATVASICTALAALIAAIAGIACADNTTKITITPDVNGNLVDVYGFECLPNRNILKIEDKTAAPASGYATTLAAIRAVDVEWYGVAVDVNSDAILTEVAADIETVDKLFGCNTSSYQSAIFTTLQGLAYANSFGLVKLDRVLSYAGAGMLGVLLPKAPGRWTAAFKTLAGVAADILFGQESAIENAGGNWYSRVGGVNISFPGKTFSGEYIDVTVFVHYLTARIQEGVFSALVNNDVIPFTDSGVDIIRNVIQNILDTNTERPGRTAGLAAKPAPFVTAPLVKDVSAADKAARTLPDVTFQGVLSGAIHELTIRGTLTV